MIRFSAALAILSFCFPGLSAAGEKPVVVELYSSQGCSACPPAQELFGELLDRDDVIALTLHVDYWDYIGWKDTFGDPAHAARQRAYAAQAGRKSIYTPEFIIDGQMAIIGAKPMKLLKAVEEHGELTGPVGLSLEREGDRLRIEAAAEGATPSEMDVFLLRYTPHRTADIQRGENAGRKITYRNVVEDWTHVQVWDGQAPLNVAVEMTGDKPAVVLIQTAGAGPILAAGRVD